VKRTPIQRSNALAFLVAGFTRLFFTILFAVTASAQTTETLSLAECYQRALTQSEALARRIDDIRAAEARYDEAFSLLYPKVHATALQTVRSSEKFGRRSLSTSQENPNADVRSQGKYPRETAIVLQQPLFTGFREYYVALAAQSEIKALEFDRTRAEQLLYQDVANLFYQIHLYTRDIEILNKTIEILRARISDLREFIELGKSRDSEILAAQSGSLAISAAIAEVEGLLSASREMLAFFIGARAESFALADATKVPVLLPLDTLIETSRVRADVQASVSRIEGATRDLIAARRERWPVLSLEGNYYPYEDPNLNRDWDLLFRFDLPLFEGGGIDARIRQSAIRKHSATLTQQEMLRIAERDVRTVYQDIISSQTRVARLKEQLDVARKNHAAQRRDYEVGVVTNLEVLSAIRTVQDNERELLDAEIALQMGYARLQVATGTIS
jgi:outer membrane protein